MDDYRHFLMKLIFITDIPYSNEIAFVYSISVLDKGLSVLKPFGVKKSILIWNKPTCKKVAIQAFF